MRVIFEAASALICASAPARGGSSTTASKRLQFQRRQRLLEQVALLGGDGLEAFGLRARPAASAASACAVLLHRMHLGPPRQRQGEGAQPGKQIGNVFGALGQRQTRAPAAPPRLPSSPAERHAAAASHARCRQMRSAGLRCSSTISSLKTMRAIPACAKALRDCGRQRRRQLARPAERQIEAGGGFGDMHFALSRPRSGSAPARRRSSASASKAGVSTRHSRMSTMAWLRAA